MAAKHTDPFSTAQLIIVLLVIIAIALVSVVFFGPSNNDTLTPVVDETPPSESQEAEPIQSPAELEDAETTLEEIDLEELDTSELDALENELP